MRRDHYWSNVGYMPINAVVSIGHAILERRAFAVNDAEDESLISISEALFDYWYHQPIGEK